MNELALFAGAGGGVLGGKLLRWRTVCAVEFDEYARNILLARQDDGCLPPFPVWDDVRTFDGKPWRGVVDIITGGFPCQDISAAGKGAGINGERSGLWREMARIVGEVRPRYVLVENSPMLVGRGLATVVSDFAEMGYDASWGVFSAADVGAQHIRERIWIVAHADEMGGKVHPLEKPWGSLPRHRVDFVEPIQFATDAPVLRGADGMADWMDRVARCGNGQVPGVVRTAWHALTGCIANVPDQRPGHK